MEEPTLPPDEIHSLVRLTVSEASEKPPKEEDGASDRPPPINEIVNFLEAHAPASLEELRIKYPEADKDKVLKRGILAGNKFKHLLARIETSYKGLEWAISVCERLIPEIQAKLRQANRFQFIGQIMTVAGGASVFGTLAADFPKPATYAAAIVTLIGSLMPHISRYASQSLEADKNIFDVFKEVVACRSESSLIKQELEPWLGKRIRTTDEESLLEGLVTKANTLCARVTQVEPLI